MSRAADDRALHAHSSRVALLAVVWLLSACKPQHSQTAAPQSSAPPDNASNAAAALRPDEPVPEAAASGPARNLTVRAVIASLPTEYSAAFVDDRLHSITEIRQVGERRVRGSYEFYGARLTRYSGQQLTSPALLQLEFDLRGTLTSTAADLDSSQIEQIKSRAQLLRSHALAQQAARTH